MGLPVEDLRLLAVHGRRREAGGRLRRRRCRDGDPVEPSPRREGVPLAGRSARSTPRSRRRRLAHELGLTVSFFPIDATRAGLVEYLDLLETRGDGRPRRRGRPRRHVRRPLAARGPHVRPPDAGAYGRAARDAFPHGLRARRRQHADRRRARASRWCRRPSPGIGERAGQHPDGGDGPRAPHDVRRSTPGIRTRAVLRALEARDAARGRRRSRRTGRSSASGSTTSSRASSRRGSATSATSCTESFPYRPELVGQPAPVLVLGKGSGLDSVAGAARSRTVARRRPSRSSRSSRGQGALARDEGVARRRRRSCRDRRRLGQRLTRAAGAGRKQMKEAFGYANLEWKRGHRLGRGPRMASGTRAGRDGAARARRDAR